MKTNINQLKNILNSNTVEDLCKKYLYITVYCNDGNKPFYENVNGKMVSNGAMVDIVVKEQLYSLYVNGNCVKHGGDELSWEILKPLFDNNGVNYDGKFYQFDYVELVEVPTN